MAIIKKHEAIANIFGMKFKGKLGWFICGRSTYNFFN